SFLHAYFRLPHLHSFPTRRSSDVPSIRSAFWESGTSRMTPSSAAHPLGQRYLESSSAASSFGSLLWLRDSPLGSPQRKWRRGKRRSPLDRMKSNSSGRASMVVML